MELMVKFHLLESAWDHLKEVKREKPHHSSGWNERNFPPLIITSITTPITDQLVTDSWIETLDICLSTYNEIDEHICIPMKADLCISFAFDYLPFSLLVFIYQL